MVKRIKTQKGDVVNFDDYIAALREQYNVLMNAENKDLGEIAKVQDDFFALLLWHGNEEEISYEDIERVVKDSKNNPQRQAANEGFANYIHRKEQQMRKQKENPKVVSYLKKIWPYYHLIAPVALKAQMTEAIGSYTINEKRDDVALRATIISDMCGHVLDLKDEDLVPKSEEEARRYIQQHWEALHIGKEIIEALEEMKCEFDIVDKSDYENRNKPDAPYRRFTNDNNTNPGKFPDKKFVDALKHKQKLISNLLIYEEKWKAETHPGEMDLSDWEIVQNDVQPDKKYDKQGVYRHNFVQNASGRVPAILQAASLEYDDVVEIVKNRMVNEMLEKAYPAGKGLPEGADLDAVISGFERNISEKDLQTAIEEYASKIAIEEKNASEIYEEKEHPGSVQRYIKEINEVNQQMDDFIKGERKIGDHENGYTYGHGIFAFQHALEVLASSNPLTDVDKLNSAEALGKFANLYLENMNSLYPKKDTFKDLNKLTTKLIEIKSLAGKMLSGKESENLIKSLDESINKMGQCVADATVRMATVEYDRNKREEEIRKREEERAREEEARRIFLEKKAERDKIFEESDKQIEEEYEREGIIVSELIKEFEEDAKRAWDVRGGQNKLLDVRIAQRWGYDPCRKADDELNISEAKRLEREEERIDKMFWRTVSDDVENAQISLLGLPAKEFPGKATPLENKLNFMTRFLSDPDFKKNKDVAEFIDKQHILFEQVRAGALKKQAKPAELLMRMYSEAQKSIAWLSVYNHKNPAMSAALHEAINTVNIKLFAPLTMKDSRIQPVYQECVDLIRKNENDPFSKEFLRSRRLMEQSLKLNNIQENGIIAKVKIVNNAIDSKEEKVDVYADYMAMRLLSMTVANDKKHSLAVGELESPSLALLGHPKFTERFIDNIKQSKSFETLCNMDPVEFRKCVMVNEGGLSDLAKSMIQETVKAFTKDEFDEAMLEAQLTEEPKVKKPAKEKENKEAVQVFGFK